MTSSSEQEIEQLIGIDDKKIVTSELFELPKENLFVGGGSMTLK